MKKIFISVLTTGIALAFLCSCINMPSVRIRKPEVYDLRPGPVSERVSIPMDVLPFSNESPARSKMLYRLENGRIRIDEFSKWAQSPSAMLTRCVRGAFQCPEKAENMISLRGTIITFEADLKKKAAVLVVNYVILDKHGSSPRIIPVETISPMEDDSPESYVSAMEKAVSMQVKKICEIVKKLK